jgi:hypothetical protein
MHLKRDSLIKEGALEEIARISNFKGHDLPICISQGLVYHVYKKLMNDNALDKKTIINHLLENAMAAIENKKKKTNMLNFKLNPNILDLGPKETLLLVFSNFDLADPFITIALESEFGKQQSFNSV